uniref:Agglutinin_C domain-containing protein n=1 Tax=Parastrongyloides trichosuri TaxID=131310 RepID=A0A0N4Z6S9_PARTI
MMNMKDCLEEHSCIDFYTDDNNTNTAIEFNSQYNMSTFGQEFHPYSRADYYHTSASRRIKELFTLASSKMCGSEEDQKFNFAKVAVSSDETHITAVLTEFSRAYFMTKPNGDWIFLERSNDGRHNTMYIMDKEKNGNNVKIVCS